MLTQFGMEEATQYVDTIDAILNFDEDYFLIGHVDFDRLYKFATNVVGFVPDGLWQKLLDWLKKEYGLELTVDQVKQILKLAGMVYDDMQKINIQDNGGDIQIPSKAESGSNVKTHGRMAVDLQRMHVAAEELLRLADLLGRASSEVRNIAENLHLSQQHATSLTLRTSLLASSTGIQQMSDQTKGMGNALNTITGKYESSESFILSLF